MTFTDPAGSPSLLEAVVRIEHHRVLSLLLEAHRATESDTPGVLDEISSQLGDEVIAHLNAEAELIHPDVLRAIGEPEHRELLDEARSLERLVRGEGSIDLAGLDAALNGHVDRFESLLARLAAVVGERHMAGLGFRFGPAAESAPRQGLIRRVPRPDPAEVRD